jgi:hypothetical protein
MYIHVHIHIGRTNPLTKQVGDDLLSTEEEKKLHTIAHYVNEKDAILWRTFSRFGFLSFIATIMCGTPSADAPPNYS